MMVQRCIPPHLRPQRVARCSVANPPRARATPKSTLLTRAPGCSGALSAGGHHRCSASALELHELSQYVHRQPTHACRWRAGLLVLQMGWSHGCCQMASSCPLSKECCQPEVESVFTLKRLSPCCAAAEMQRFSLHSGSLDSSVVSLSHSATEPVYPVTADSTHIRHRTLTHKSHKTAGWPVLADFRSVSRLSVATRIPSRPRTRTRSGRLKDEAPWPVVYSYP